MNHFKETVKLLSSSNTYYSIAIGMDSHYTYVSPSYDNNFKLMYDTLLGKPFHVTLHPDDVKICAEVGALCFASPDDLFPATLRKHDGNGGFVSTQWELKALFDDAGNPDGIFCVGFNITEHIDTRTKLVSAETEIEQKTDQLNEIGFIQSHVIRKPLANILGLSSILANMEMDTDLQEINKKLMESAHELDGVIRTIVDKTA
jgi:WD40 repeat protein